MKDPHFQAEIEIFTGKEGPVQGFFGFLESGLRAVPTEMAGVEGLNTVGIFYKPNAELRSGGTFNASCSVISEECFAPAMAEGKEFFIWDGRRIARGVITKLYTENWHVNLPAREDNPR